MYQDDVDKFATLVELLQQLIDQNEYNRKMCASLSNLASQLKTQAADTASVTPLHRVNVDLSKEVFESELERTNAQTIIENHSLLHENRQLSVLLKEYEQTMDTIMSKFRSHAIAAQQHELTLTRHYEKLLYTPESSSMHRELTTNTNIAMSLSRLSHLLRCLTRSMAGEDTTESPHHISQSRFLTSTSTYPPKPYGEYDADHSYLNASSSPDSSDSFVSPITADDSIELLDELLGDQEDWAVERENEISRLERENDELRKILGIDRGTAEKNGWLEDEARDMLVTSRYTPIHAHGRSSPSGSQGSGIMGSLGGGGGGGGGGGNGGGSRMERSGSPVLGVGMFSGMRPPPPSPFMSVPSSLGSNNTGYGVNERDHPSNGGPPLGGVGGGINSQISVHLSQGTGSLGVVASQARESTLPGMRGTQGRRPAMFGRGRGGGGAGPQMARDVVHFGGPDGGLERPWQAQVGLDLS